MARGNASATRSARTISRLNALLGIWLVMSPFVLGYFDELAVALSNDMIVGLAVLLLAVGRMSQPAYTSPARATNLVLGLWLVLAPFVLGYSEVAPAMWNDVIAGCLVSALALWSGFSMPAEQP